ncbi:hypothetical protein [Clostridium felsineum]|uniref:Uncharacterized protein n=1 Tax=Clostridium felsineum TaxID=36839 RepID=A0A1S8MEX8_9CLOT|nr:hypothetical protein [Clostridium felsineum]MCR3758688.1 hypothetical protein [Clostridium felsineum]URZ09264.1 hypothetical protein CLROS_046800 [Clostridium felsineum]URZ13950.1 hypothetical protein CROST_047280 [Clostridium felsineum]URZ18505.1 hypothetical protein CLFE_045930 [Clostridium felsineum DSM 794]
MVNKKIEECLKKIKINELLQMDITEFSSFLVSELGIFSCEKDFKIFIIDYITKALYNDNVDFPITYYDKNKESLKNKYIDTKLRSFKS